MSVGYGNLTPVSAEKERTMADFMTVTLVGGVVDKPELQTTQTGKSLLH